MVPIDLRDWFYWTVEFPSMYPHELIKGRQKVWSWGERKNRPSVSKVGQWTKNFQSSFHAHERVKTNFGPRRRPSNQSLQMRRPKERSLFIACATTFKLKIRCATSFPTWCSSLTMSARLETFGYGQWIVLKMMRSSSRNGNFFSMSLSSPWHDSRLWHCWLSRNCWSSMVDTWEKCFQWTSNTARRPSATNRPSNKMASTLINFLNNDAEVFLGNGSEIA